jgi:hypothetical protein
MQTMSKLEAFTLGTGILGLVADVVTLLAFAGSYWGVTPLPTGAAYMLIIGLGLLGLWLLCVFAYRRVRRSPILGPTGSRIETIPSRQARAAALSGIVGLPLAGLLALGGWGVAQLQPHQEIVILVTDIAGPEPERYGVTDNILHSLRTELSDTQGTHVRYLPRSVSEGEGAQVAKALGTRAFGSRNDATVVIWGSTNAHRLTCK